MTHDFIQFVYSFDQILAPKRHIDKYFDYIKQLKPCGEDLKYDRLFSLCIFLERVVLKCLFDF